ncbi:MAG: hypothetical protein ACQEQF_08830 [Bacillota bacterium]
MLSVILKEKIKKDVISLLEEVYTIPESNESDEILIGEKIRLHKKKYHIENLIIDIDLLEKSENHEFIKALQDIVLSTNEIKIIILTTLSEDEKYIEILQKIVSFGIYNIIEYPSTIEPKKLVDRIIKEINTDRKIKDVYKYHSLNIAYNKAKPKVKIKKETIEKIKTIRTKIIGVCSATRRSGATTISVSMANHLREKVNGDIYHISLDKREYMQRLFIPDGSKKYKKELENILLGNNEIKPFKKDRVKYLYNYPKNKKIKLKHLHKIILTLKDTSIIILDVGDNIETFIDLIPILDESYFVVEDDPLYEEKAIKIIKEKRIDIMQSKIIINNYKGLINKNQIRKFYYNKTKIEIDKFIKHDPECIIRSLKERKITLDDINKITKDINGLKNILKNNSGFLKKIFK